MDLMTTILQYGRTAPGLNAPIQPAKADKEGAAQEERLLAISRQASREKFQAGNARRDTVSIRKKAVSSAKAEPEWAQGAQGKNLSLQESLADFDSRMEELSWFDLSSGSFDAADTVSRFASEYAVLKERVSKECGGDDLKMQMDSLDAILEKHVDRFASRLSEQVGAFYERNGMKGEQEKLFRSIQEGLTGAIEQYGHFLAENKSLLEPGEGQEWMGTQSGYLAGKLRGAYDDAGEGMPPLPGNYSIQDVENAAQLAKAADKIAKSGHAGAVSEEELGMRLGMIALDALEAIGGPEALDEHKQVVYRAAGARMEALLDESEKLLDPQADPSAGWNPPLDRTAAMRLADTIVGAYQATGSKEEALLTGQKRGLQIFLAKRDQGGYGSRYTVSSYWESVSKSLRRRLAEMDESAIRKQRWQATPLYKASTESLFGMGIHA